MRGRTSPRPSWKRARLLLAVVALLALVAGPVAVNGTLAGWSDSKESQGEFSSGSLGPVRNLKCIDSGDGLLPGLLRTQVKLEWDPPEGVDGDLISYEIYWRQTGLLGGSRTDISDTPSYVYTASSLSLVTLNTQFEVKAKLRTGSWVGPVGNASATSVGLILVSVYMNCN